MIRCPNWPAPVTSHPSMPPPGSGRYPLIRYPPLWRHSWPHSVGSILTACQLASPALQKCSSSPLSAFLVISNVVVYMDDFAPTQEIHDATLEAVQTALADAGAVLNPDKCTISTDSVKFLGHMVSAEGISPDSRKLEALVTLQAPTDIAELRRALGMFTFLSKLLPEMATVSTPLRLLLKSDSAWQWTDAQQATFDCLKQLTSSTPCLALFDPSQPCKARVDASSYGLGAVLLQPRGSNWVTVAYASRSLTTAESWYAQIEKECLAFVWACEHLHHFLYGGSQFTVETDHKPLVPLINSADLDRTPLCCQRLLLRLMKYNVVAMHVPGQFLTVADTLSRALLPSMQSSSALQDDVPAFVSAITHNPSCHVDNQRLRSATLLDPIASRLSDFILDGWPSTSNSVPSDLRPYFPFRGQLSAVNDLIYCGSRIFVPESCQTEVLSTFHEGHQGITKCRAQSSWQCLVAFCCPGDCNVHHQLCQLCEVPGSTRWTPEANRVSISALGTACLWYRHTRCNQLSDRGRLFFPVSFLSPALLQQPVQPSFGSSRSCLLPMAYRQPLSQTAAPSFLEPSLQSSAVSLISIFAFRRQSVHRATVRLSVLFRQPRTWFGRTPTIWMLPLWHTGHLC